MRRVGRVRAAFVGLGGLCLVLAPGCDSPSESRAASAGVGTALSVPGPIVDISWLRGVMEDGRLIVVDTREAEAYARGHIPGAVSLPRGSTDDPSRPNCMGPVGHIEALLGGAGIDNATTVVLYDSETYRDAARVFWVMEAHGHPGVAVLNGGLGAWTALGLPLSAEPAARAPRRFIANLNPDRMVSKLQVMQATTDERAVLLDARSLEEYRGEKTSTERAGHIPHALSADAKANLDKSPEGVCSIQDPEVLRALYAPIPEDRRLITYCNTGTRASISYLVLRSLGRNVAVYDGSWEEWSADRNLPIEVGPEPGPITAGVQPAGAARDF